MLELAGLIENADHVDVELLAPIYQGPERYTKSHDAIDAFRQQAVQALK